MDSLDSKSTGASSHRFLMMSGIGWAFFSSVWKATTGLWLVVVAGWRSFWNSVIVDLKASNFVSNWEVESDFLTAGGEGSPRRYLLFSSKARLVASPPADLVLLRGYSMVGLGGGGGSVTRISGGGATSSAANSLSVETSVAEDTSSSLEELSSSDSTCERRVVVGRKQATMTYMGRGNIVSNFHKNIFKG